MSRTRLHLREQLDEYALDVMRQRSLWVEDPKAIWADGKRGGRDSTRSFSLLFPYASMMDLTRLPVKATEDPH